MSLLKFLENAKSSNLRTLDIPVYTMAGDIEKYKEFRAPSLGMVKITFFKVNPVPNMYNYFHCKVKTCLTAGRGPERPQYTQADNLNYAKL
jgi:hypothetical protein